MDILQRRNLIGTDKQTQGMRSPAILPPTAASDLTDGLAGAADKCCSPDKSPGPNMNDPSECKEGFKRGFAGGRLCHSWQHFCSSPCPGTRDPSAGDFFRTCEKNFHQTESTKAHGSHWHCCTGTEDWRHLGAQKEHCNWIPLPIKLVSRDSIKVQDLWYFREWLQKKGRCVKPNKLCANAMSKWAWNINDI